MWGFFCSFIIKIQMIVAQVSHCPMKVTAYPLVEYIVP